MTWNAASPSGAISVKANRTQMNANNTYIQTTMGNSVVGTNTVTTRDHFWNVGSNEDGRHRFMQSPAFTVGGNAANPVIGTGMNGVLYLRTINGRAEWFSRNSATIYQVSAGFLSGTHVVTAAYTNMVAVPANVFGEIFMWTTALGKNSVQTGFFRSAATDVESFTIATQVEGSSNIITNLKFANGADKSGLNIRPRSESAAAGSTWNYRISYRNWG